jgi:Tfp pilus assembly protein PilZ
MSEDRRSSPRYNVTLPVRFSSEMLEFEGQAEVSGEVSDVSEGGLFVRCELLEVPGTPVRLVVSIPKPESQQLPLHGTVAWIADEPPKGPGMGIRLDRPIDLSTLQRLSSR